MSQNGEAATTSSATRPSQPSFNSTDLSEEQRQTVNKCTEIVQDFRSGAISKPKASFLLQRVIPHDDSNEQDFLSVYETYFDMLDNFERYQRSNTERIDNVHQRLTGTGSPHAEADGANSQPGPADSPAPFKRQHTPSSDDEDDGYTKRTRLDFNALPWNVPEDSRFVSSSNLTPALQETNSLLENFSRDVKRARSSFLKCNRPIPQFPQSEWLNLLGGNAVDLDHVFSNIYTVSHNTNDVIELGKSIELLHGSSTPAKTVKTHGDWVIAWDCYVEATLFVFKHRGPELQSYGKHIQRYFASLPSQYHSRVINYDRAARIRAAQRRDVELSNFSEFTDLQIQWISNPSTSNSTQPAEPGAGKGKKGRRSAACRRWNENRCPNSAATCNYLHVCVKCSSPDHVASKCDSPGKK